MSRDRMPYHSCCSSGQLLIIDPESVNGCFVEPGLLHLFLELLHAGQGFCAWQNGLYNASPMQSHTAIKHVDVVAENKGFNI